MDYSHLLSPAVIVVVVAACAGIAAQIVADARRAIASRRLYAQLFAQLRQQQAKPVTVIIELRRAAETILPLLDHLREQKYAKLTVIVMIRQTAGSRAQTKLATYRRTAVYSQLRLVKHRKGMTILSVVGRYAPRGLVMQLGAGDRVGRDFFQQVSFHFADAQVGAVVPRAQTLLTTSLGSAFQAVIAVWLDLKKSLVTQPPVDSTIRPGVVYRTASFLNKKLAASQAVYSQTAYVTHLPLPRMTVAMTRVASPVMAVWLIAAVIALSVYGFVATDGTLGFFLLAVYCVLLSVRLSAIKGYSLLDKLTILLFGPLSLPLFLGIAVFDFIYGIRQGVSYVVKAPKLVGTPKR